MVTVLIMLVLLVPTMVIVHIRSRRLERAIEWVATLPLTIPAIVLVVGLGPIYRWLSADVLSTNPIWLCFATWCWSCRLPSARLRWDSIPST